MEMLLPWLTRLFHMNRYWLCWKTRTPTINHARAAFIENKR
jgi:hypothetical protein